MSDRGRPHNIGQALFEGLGAGLGAFGSFLEQERIRKSESNQQNFLNDLRTAEAGRSQERLGIAQEGLGLRQDDFQRQKQVDLFNAMQKLTIDPMEQSQIDLRGAQQGAAEALTAQRGRTGGGGGKPLTSKNRVDLLQDLFQQSVSGGQERLLGETVGRLGELGAFTSDSTQGFGFTEDASGGISFPGKAENIKPPTNILGLRAFLAQRPELAQDSAVGDLSHRLFELGSQPHQQAFTSSPDSSFAINPFVAEQIFPDIDLESLRIDNEDFVAGGSEALKLLREQVPGFDNYPDSVKVDFLNEMEAALAGER